MNPLKYRKGSLSCTGKLKVLISLVDFFNFMKDKTLNAVCVKNIDPKHYSGTMPERI